MERYPAGDWPDWFRNVVDAADGLLRTHFRHGMSPVRQWNLLAYLDEAHKAGATQSELVSMFEDSVRRDKEGS